MGHDDGVDPVLRYLPIEGCMAVGGRPRGLNGWEAERGRGPGVLRHPWLVLDVFVAVGEARRRAMVFFTIYMMTDVTNGWACSGGYPLLDRLHAIYTGFCSAQGLELRGLFFTKSTTQATAHVKAGTTGSLDRHHCPTSQIRHQNITSSSS